jgi:hypothetical protein
MFDDGDLVESPMCSAVTRSNAVKINGLIYNDPKKNKNISAIDQIGDQMLVGADEGGKIKVLKQQADQSYKVDYGIELGDREIDIEGITSEGDTVYVIGSHSYKRKKVDPVATYARNQTAIAQTTLDRERDQLFRFRLGPDPKIDQISLRDLLENDEILSLFCQIPSKENGVDIEGIAVRDQQLYIGFRGPVLRGNWVPVWRCEFQQPLKRVDGLRPTGGHRLWVNLGGRGIRDLARVDDGFLILAGPVGDGPGGYQVYFWDGLDCLPGERSAGQPALGRLQCLGDVALIEGHKPEGLTVVAETVQFYRAIIVVDGMVNGDPHYFQVMKSAIV